MKIALESLDLRGLVVDLAMGEATAESRIAVVRSAERVRGRLESGEGGFTVSGLSAASLDLDALHLDFGPVVIDASSGGDDGPSAVGATLRRLEGRTVKSGERLLLDLRADEVSASKLVVDVIGPGLRVSGRVRIGGVRLEVDDGSGRLEGRDVAIDDFRLSWGEVEVRAPRVEASAMVIGWGDVFTLRAGAAAGPEVEITLGSPRADLALGGVRLEGVRLEAGDVDVRAAAFETLGLEAALAREDVPPAEPSHEAAEEREPIFDLRMLDGLDGELNLDLFVDLSVPVIGSRRATHRFRVPVQAGSVDFIGLENDLSALENALLDFAVRSDGTLVLEVGIPLLPTRGRGKPIVAWDLGPEDRVLAEHDRVRLALLPRVRPAGEPAGGAGPEDAASREKDESPFALRKLEFQSIEASLSLAPVSGIEGAFESVSVKRLALRGDVHYDPEAPAREGEIRGELADAQLVLRPLVLGTQALAIGRLAVERGAGLRVGLLGARATTLEGALENVAVENLALRGA